MTKKLINILLAVLLLPAFTMAQGRIAEIWTQPAVYNADEQISVFFDITGTELAEVAEAQGVCVWTWYPADPGETWGKPSDKTKLKHVEGNIWRWDFVPTELYKVDASSITAFYGQLQTTSGEKQAVFAPDQDPPNAIGLYSLATVKGDDAILDYWPKDFTLDRPLSVLVNANHAYPDNCSGDVVPGQLAGAPNVHVHAGVNAGIKDWEIVVENNPSNSAKTALTDMGNGIYRWDFIPNDYFGLEEGMPVTNISAVFASSDWAYIGKNAGCTDFFIEVPEQPEVPTPELLFFPSKISKKDILIISRSQNEAYVTSLNYTITAGSKTLTGNFNGTNKSMTAFINLVDELKNVDNLEKINVAIKDNTGRIVSKIDIPLVQLND